MKRIEAAKKDKEKVLVYGDYDVDGVTSSAVLYNALNEHVIAMRTEEWKIMCRLKDDTTYLPKIYNIYEGNEAIAAVESVCELQRHNVTFGIKNRFVVLALLQPYHTSDFKLC